MLKEEKKYYRVEYNEKQQGFHLDNYTHDENTFGWVTIIKQCTNDEFKVFEAYVNRLNKNKITVNYLNQCLKELNSFKENLKKYNHQIKRNYV